MNEKRRDNKNRILHEGEMQLADGRYRYKYRDLDGRECYVYSWRLVQNDTNPSGKRKCAPLREQEKEINTLLFKGVSANDAKMTVLELVERYTETRANVRATTKIGYKTVINYLKTDPFAKRAIGTVKVSDAKTWLIKLQQEKGKGYSSIHTIRGVLRPAFRMAVEDEILSKNPFDFELATVIYNDSISREAITKDQERKFLKFIEDDIHFSRYFEGFKILFKTGLRISEFVGLTISNIDFKEHKIIVDHQLQYANGKGLMIEDTKTESGRRILPMSEEVEECFRRIIQKRRKPSREPVIDGYKGFLYLNKEDRPLVSYHWEKYFQHAVEKYNNTFKEELPQITPHVCRHTYCTNMAKSGMNPKTLQYLMGHSDIGITLNTYTHVKYEDAEKEVKRLREG